MSIIRLHKDGYNLLHQLNPFLWRLPLLILQNICFNGWGLPFYPKMVTICCRKGISFFGIAYLFRQRWMTKIIKHITLTKESCSRTTPLPSTDGVRTSHILPRKPTLYPKFSCRNRPGCMAPGLQSYPSESLALIGRTDWRLRHLLHEKTI